MAKTKREMTTRLLHLLWCNMDALPMGEIRQLVAALHGEAVYECATCGAEVTNSSRHIHGATWKGQA